MWFEGRWLLPLQGENCIFTWAGRMSGSHSPGNSPAEAPHKQGYFSLFAAPMSSSPAWPWPLRRK